MIDHLDDFRVYLKTVKKSSDNTVEAYIRDVSQFLSYCTLNNNIFDLKTIHSEQIVKYADFLKFSGKSDATKTRVIASIRCYFKFLISIGEIKGNPADGIKNPRSAKKLPGILDSKEIILLLSQPIGDDCKSIRDRAMLELLYATGIRVSELIDLSVTDINLQIGILNLQNSRSSRIIPIYPAAIKHLSEYINTARPVIIQGLEEDKLFTNMNGRKMSRQGCWKIIKHYAEQAGIKSDITPHTLRHSFAAHLLENGAQLKDIKEMLGHSDISSTQVYAQLIKNKYVQSYSKFHPMAK